MLRRTTVVAEDDDLAVLAQEAKARHMALGALIGALVAQEAAELRRRRRPRVGTFSVEAAIADAEEDPAAQPFRR